MEKISDIDLARKARAAYMRKYRAEHPDKVREIQRRYWIKRALREERSDSVEL